MMKRLWWLCYCVGHVACFGAFADMVMTSVLLLISRHKIIRMVVEVVVDIMAARPNSNFDR